MFNFNGFTYFIDYPLTFQFHRDNRPYIDIDRSRTVGQSIASRDHCMGSYSVVATLNYK